MKVDTVQAGIKSSSIKYCLLKSDESELIKKKNRKLHTVFFISRFPAFFELCDNVEHLHKSYIQRQRFHVKYTAYF